MTENILLITAAIELLILFINIKFWSKENERHQ